MENNLKQKSDSASDDKKITRKQALKKAGFYAATAAGMIALLGTPNKSATAGTGEPAANPEW